MIIFAIWVSAWLWSFPVFAQTTQVFSTYVGSLPAAGAITGNETLYALQGGSSVKVKIGQIVGASSAGHILTANGNGQVVDSSALGTTSLVSPTGLSITRNPVIANGDPATALALSWQQNISGTCSNALCSANLIQANSINVTANAVDILRVNASCCNSLLIGSIQALEADLTINHTSGNTSSLGYVALVTSVTGSVNDNGTSGSYIGSIVGANLKATLTGSATFWHSVRGTEIDYGAGGSSSVHFMDGLAVVLVGTNTVSGDLQNAGVRVSAGSGATPTITCAFCIGGYEGFNPLASDASILAFLPHGGSGLGPTITNGIDLTNFTFTGKSFSSSNFSIDGSGVITGSAYKTGANVGVDCSGAPSGSFASSKGIVTHC